MFKIKHKFNRKPFKIKFTEFLESFSVPFSLVSCPALLHFFFLATNIWLSHVPFSLVSCPALLHFFFLATNIWLSHLLRVKWPFHRPCLFMHQMPPCCHI
ncbi:hypothetical protein QL285_032539 [Trifolium repens]|nr:hypothetical protein QL285_032539 [Trifolium repens]